MADTLQQLLRERADQDTVAIKYGDRTWTWRAHVSDAARQAAALIGLADPARPLHVGVLMGNTPDMLTALAAAALGGYVLCGINTTRRGPALARDIAKVDAQFLLTDAAHRHLLDGVDLPAVTVFDTGDPEWTRLLAGAAELTPHTEAAGEDTFMMIFTSGTSGEPKAVQVPHSTVLFAGGALVQRYQLGPQDTCYLAMPLFHSNAVYAGWSVALGAGAAMAPATFSASGFLTDIRRYGATYMNYVGKPLAYILGTPEHPDDADNPLRVAFGNEAADRDIDAFGRRFGCTVWDGFGSTETAVIITRTEDCPPGSIGKGFPGVAIFDPDTGRECAVARFDDTGALLNADEATGELVNTAGSGLFRGYYNDAGATQERMRDGIYWSGDLAYRDADGWIYLAGRTADWMRVDGENLTSAPIERILLRLPVINRVAVYPVPDEFVGDQVMAAIVLNDGKQLSADEFAGFLAAQRDLSPKAWPRYVWLADDLPGTATNKILKRELVAMGADPAGRVIWRRDGTRYADQP
ncbi:acyl-CoA synthetase [Mycolicibacterium canariasense]|uniref:Acyl-CoA synthetase n=1 Tax=Mycolicibacterium canariasense TaxID=228230 RepID=A0A124E2X6_MYCCR|nr:fatty-acid--CoA ligase FadD1 [Mycolicibacterium canariasense]MCV7210584.1 AMP-binding protein [Mycolicibacterium canariasense]ORU96074.1 acyl-CoA synthetase [Mycolicibacterium canariasense]GAS98190.1 acyl-CoA synthetase [Mycolicibacterium canariasense]